MASGDRPQFLARAIRCFQRQRYASRELIVVDDGEQPAQALIPQDPRIRYLRLTQRTALGEKLNLAIEQAAGALVQKLDDDDWYAPDFLGRMVAALRGRDPTTAMAALDCFLVLIAHSGHLTFSGHGWFAGNSLCFHRRLWEKTRFRAVGRAEDWWFVNDHAPLRVKVCAPQLAMVVRHRHGHAWSRMGDGDVTSWFERRPALATPLSAVVDAEDFAFYRSLRASIQE
jgi:glycosyltransferase involved in cell wall biosynthesis